MTYQEGDVMTNKDTNEMYVYVQGVWFPIEPNFTEDEIKIQNLERENRELRSEISTLKAMRREIR